MMASEERSIGSRSVSTDASPKTPAPCDTRLYLCDERLSLEAKGLLAIVSNYSYEQIVELGRNSAEFDEALSELRSYGYVGVFDADTFEMRLTLPPDGGDHA